MKTTFLISAFTILNLNAFAQGFGDIVFANSSANPVFLCDGSLVPRAASGGTYLVELLSAPDGADFRAATRAGGTATFNSARDGIFLGGGRTVPTTVDGGFAQFQVRVLDSRAGARYEEALVLGDLRYQLGESPIFIRNTRDPLAIPPLGATAAPLIMPSFAIGVPGCPEPSTYTLALLAAGALWLLRRKK